MKKLIIILFISIGFSQINSTKFGVGLNIGNVGSGIFYHQHIKGFEKVKLGARLSWTDVRPAREIPVYNYYTGQYENENTVSLIMFPLFGTFNYYPFEGKIANNFSPYLSIKGGPVLVLDGDESIESFAKRWSKASGSLAYGGNIGVGIEFRQSGSVHYLVELTYDMIPLKNTIDGYGNLNGTVLSLSIHR